MKRLTIVILLIFTQSLLDSCATDDFFDVDLELTGANNVSMESYERMDFQDTISADNFAIELLGTAEIRLSEIADGFGSKLLAEAAYSLADQATAISITSTSDLGSSFPAGSELKSLFEAQEVQEVCIGNPGATSDCVTNYSSFDFIRSLEQGFNERLSIGFVEREGSLSLFKLTPTGDFSPAKHSFTINFEFQSGKTVQLITPEVFIQ
jgi:hypothetical protein